MTVGTVAVNSVPIDGGAGDVLPADEYCDHHNGAGCKRIRLLVTTLLALRLLSVPTGTIRFLDGSDAELLVLTIPSTEIYTWHNQSGLQIRLHLTPATKSRSANLHYRRSLHQAGVVFD